MHAIQGTVSNGQIVLDDPIEFGEGTRVEVLPIAMGLTILGMREEDWPTTREGISALVARMDAVGPSWLTPADDAAWRADRQERRTTEKARFAEDSEKLRSMWE